MIVLVSRDLLEDWTLMRILDDNYYIGEKNNRIIPLITEECLYKPIERNKMVNYPVVNAIAETYKFAFGTFESLSLFFRDVIEQPYFAEQKSQFLNESDKYGGKWIKECCEDLIFVHATEQIERQKLQQGFYILFPNEIESYGDDYCFNKVIKPIDKDNKQIKARSIIKKERKCEILKKLEFLGISEATLFADNIDIVCKNIVDQCKKIRY